MDKYRILCDLTLKKLKNNLMIVIAEKTYMLIIFLISFISVAGGLFYIKELFVNLTFTPEYSKKIYYCIFFLSQIPFVFLKLCEREKQESNYLLEFLFGPNKIQIMAFVRNRIFAFIYAFMIILFFITRFDNLPVFSVVMKWMIFTTLVQLFVEWISYLYIKKSLKNLNYKVDYNLINCIFYVLILFAFAIFFCFFQKSFWTQSRAGIILFVLFLTVQYFYYKMSSMQIQMKLLLPKGVIVLDKTRIDTYDDWIYFSRAKIGSEKFSIFCGVCGLFIICYSFIFKSSMVSLTILNLSLGLGLIIYESERLNTGSLKVLSNMNANIHMYIITIEHLYYLIAITFFILIAFVIAIVNKENLIVILDSVGFLEVAVIFYLSVLCVNCIKFMIGLKDDFILRFVLMILSLLLTNVIMPYLASLYGMVPVALVAIIFMYFIQFMEVQNYGKFEWG